MKNRKVTRRKALEVGATVLLGTGLLSASIERAAAATGGKRRVKLVVKVPRNVEFTTEVQPTDAELPIDVESAEPATMDMDLTTERTKDWLDARARHEKTRGGGSACCVRG